MGRGGVEVDYDPISPQTTSTMREFCLKFHGSHRREFRQTIRMKQGEALYKREGSSSTYMGGREVSSRYAERCPSAAQFVVHPWRFRTTEPTLTHCVWGFVKKTNGPRVDATVSTAERTIKAGTRFP